MTINVSSASTGEEFRQQDHNVSIEVIPSTVVAGYKNVDPACAQHSSSAPGDSAAIATSTRTCDLGSESSPGHRSHAVVTVEPNNLPKRKCPQFCPTSLSSFFVGLGRLITGYHLRLNLPNLSKSNQESITGNTTDAPRIPFETLEEEARPEEVAPPPVQANASLQQAHVKPCSSPVILVNFQWPIFIILISLSQWVFFHFVMKDEYNGWFSSNLEFNPLKRYEIWRFITATWIHGTTAHLRGNLRLQLIAGGCLEIVHGWKRLCCIYFGGVLFANLATSVAEPFLRAYGASGGVYALLTGHLASSIMNWHECWGASNRCLLILIYLFLSVLTAFNQTVAKNGILPAHHIVGHAAHVGGALGGLIISFCILRCVNPRPWNITATKVCCKILVILFILGIGANVGDQIFYWKSLDYVRQRNLTFTVNKFLSHPQVYTSPSDASSLFDLI